MNITSSQNFWSKAYYTYPVLITLILLSLTNCFLHAQILPGVDVWQSQSTRYNGDKLIKVTSGTRLTCTEQSPSPNIEAPCPSQPPGYPNQMVSSLDTSFEPNTLIPVTHTRGINNSTNPPHLVYFIDYSAGVLPNNYEDSEGTFSSADATQLHYSTQEILSMFNLLFRWYGVSGQAGDQIGTSSYITSQIPGGKSDGGLPVYYDPAAGVFYYSWMVPQYPYVSKDIVGKQLARGVLKYSNFSSTGEGLALAEGFSDIIGVFGNSGISELTIDWTIGAFQQNPYDISEPKNYFYPNTYLGMYYEPDIASPSYAEKNSKILGFWYSLIINGGCGYIDDNPGRESYCVNPLGEGDVKTDMEEITKILFSIFTTTGGTPVNYYSLRALTLSAAGLRWGVASPQYITVMDAWHAIGVGSKYGPYNETCSAGLTGQSKFNGPVGFHGMQYTIEPAPQSQKLFVLESCAGNGLPDVVTKPLVNGQAYTFMDTDEDLVYTPDNNISFSKDAVSVHWGNETSLNYFLQEHNYAFPKPVVSYIGYMNPRTDCYDPLENTFYYNRYDDPGISPVSIDLVGHELTEAIHYHEHKAITTNEAAALRESLGDYFGAIIKNGERRKQQLPFVWTIGEDVKPGGIRDMESPETKGQLIYYPEFTPATDPRYAIGIGDKFFQLLHDGGSGHPNKNQVNGTYSVLGLGEYVTSQLAFDLLMNLAPGDGFLQAREKSLIYINGSYPGNVAYRRAVMEAWHAVGVGVSANSELQNNPAAENVIFPVGWNSTITLEALYPNEIAWTVRISDNPAFTSNTHEIHVNSFNYNRITNKVTYEITGLNFDSDPDAKTIGKRIFVQAKATAFDPLKCSDENTNPQNCAEEILNWWRPEYSIYKGSMQITVVNPDLGSPDELLYPWGETIHFTGHEGDTQYAFTVSEDYPITTDNAYINENVPSVDFANESIIVSTPLKVGTVYNMLLREKGPPNTLLLDHPQTPPAQGSYSDRISVKTSIPESEITSPSNGKISPYGGLLIPKGVKNATAYMFRIADNENMDNATDLLSIPLFSEEGEYYFGWITDEFCNYGPVEDGKKYYVTVYPVGPSLPVQPDGEYVYDETRERGAESEPQVFTVDYSLGKPQPIHPAVNEELKYEVNGNGIQFSWQAVIGALKYKVLIYEDGQEYYSKEVDAGLIDYEHKMAKEQIYIDGHFLECHHDWSWQVIAYGKEGCFAPIASDEWPYRLAPPNVEADKPISIGDSYTVVPRDMKFEWHTIPVNCAPDGFFLEYVRYNASGTEPEYYVYADRDKNHPYYSTTLARYDRKYKWRVGMYRADGSLYWASNYNYFKTEPKPQEEEDEPTGGENNENTPEGQCTVNINVKWENFIFDDGDPDNNPSGESFDAETIVGLDWSYDNVAIKPMVYASTGEVWKTSGNSGSDKQVDEFDPPYGVVQFYLHVYKHSGLYDIFNPPVFTVTDNNGTSNSYEVTGVSTGYQVPLDPPINCGSKKIQINLTQSGDGTLSSQPRCKNPAAVEVPQFSVTSTTASINWTDTNTQNYAIECSREGIQNSTILVMETNTSSILSNLVPGVEYRVRVKSICSPGHESFWSSYTNFTTPCGSPIEFKPISMAPTSTTLQWADINPLGGYLIRYKLQADTSWITTPVINGKTTVALTGLKTNETYRAQLKKMCDSGSSDWIESSFTTNACPVPYNFKTKSTGVYNAWFSWQPLVDMYNYDFQYRKVGSANWTSYYATGSIFELPGLMPNTNYEARLRTSCGDSYSEFAPVLKFTTNDYCLSKGTSQQFEWIDMVKLGSLIHESGKDGYANNTGLAPPAVNIGSTASIELSLGNEASVTRKRYWAVFMDYNHDGDFADYGEWVIAANTTSARLSWYSFSVPITASVGITRMRVVLKYGGWPLLCETFSNGEVEDYYINLLQQHSINSDETLGSKEENSVYPNPVKETLHVTGEGSRMKVTDLTGIVFYEGEYKTQLNVLDWPKRVYILIIYSPTGAKSTRFLKE